MFCDKLKELRKDARKTQNEVATYLHVRRSTYGEYERGKITPPYDKIKALAEYFEVTIEHLMEDEKEPIDVSKTLNCLIHELGDEKSNVKIDGHRINKQSRDLAINAINSAIKLIEIMIKNERT